MLEARPPRPLSTGVSIRSSVKPPPPQISAASVTQAHEELRDIYVAAITAARGFSNRGQSDSSAEAMALACDATRVRRDLEEAATKNLV